MIFLGGKTLRCAPTEAPRTIAPEEQQTGTFNDRILWTMPIFLTLEDADKLPPMTPAASYGQGMQGYAKRYGAAYADNAIENFMASAVFPSILHQDPVLA